MNKYFSFIGSYCKDIIVSKRATSKDIPSCGVTNLPCENLKYAINHQASDGDVILLDGGNKEIYTYSIKQPINITKKITIKKLSDSVPIITYPFPHDFKVPIFVISSTRITIVSIAFHKFAVLFTLGSMY